MLSDDIANIDEILRDQNGYMYKDSWSRIKTALAELDTTPNTGSPKCPNCNSNWVEWIGRGAYGCAVCSHVWGCFS